MSETKNDNKDLQNKDLQKMVETIAKKINGSPALNGGFDRMLIIVEHIQEKQDETNEKISRIHDGLYEPDEGLYARVKDVENTTQDFSKKLDQHALVDEKLQVNLNDTLKKLNERTEEINKKIETTIKLKKIAGEDLEKLDQMFKAKNIWLNIWSKSAWLIGGGILAAVGKTVWELIAHR